MFITWPRGVARADPPLQQAHARVRPRVQRGQSSGGITCLMPLV